MSDSANYGAWSQSFNGLDLTVQARVGESWTFFGGTSIGQTVADNCDVRAHLPELATTTTGTSAFGAGPGRVGGDPGRARTATSPTAC